MRFTFLFFLLMAPLWASAQKLARERITFDYIRRPPYPVVPGEKKVRMELFGSEALAPETDSATFLRAVFIQGIQNDRISPEFIIRFYYKDDVIHTIEDITKQRIRTLL